MFISLYKAVNFSIIVITQLACFISEPQWLSGSAHENVILDVYLDALTDLGEWGGSEDDGDLSPDATFFEFMRGHIYTE